MHTTRNTRCFFLLCRNTAETDGTAGTSSSMDLMDCPFALHRLVLARYFSAYSFVNFCVSRPCLQPTMS